MEPVDIASDFLVLYGGELSGNEPFFAFPMRLVRASLQMPSRPPRVSLAERSSFWKPLLKLLLEDAAARSAQLIGRHNA